MPLFGLYWRKKNIRLQKHWYANIYNILIFNNPKLEIAPHQKESR